MSDNLYSKQCLVQKAANNLESRTDEARERFEADFQAMLEDPISFMDFATEVAMNEEFRRCLPPELQKAAKRWEILLNAFMTLDEAAFEVNNGE